MPAGPHSAPHLADCPGPARGGFTLETLAPGSLHYTGRSVPPNSYRSSRLEADGETTDAHWTLGVRHESPMGNCWIQDPRGRRFSPRGPITEARQYTSGSLRLAKSETEHSDREVNSPPVLTGRPSLPAPNVVPGTRASEYSLCSCLLGGEEGHGPKSSKRANGTLSNKQHEEKWDKATGRRSLG